MVFLTRGRVLSLALCMAWAPNGFAQSPSPAFDARQREEIGAIVRDVLVKNPEVLREALAALQKKEKADEDSLREKTIQEESAKIFNSKYQAVVGNPKGSITLVEFFDYNCGYCRQAAGDVARLIKEFPDLRVVLKEFAALGRPSLEAAQVATALHDQLTPEKYWAFHQKMFSVRGKIGKEQAMTVARESGAQMDRLEKDMASQDLANGVREVADLADKLQINGTPAWVIGQETLVGAVGYEELRDKIVNMQKCGKTACG